jgi:hypothetical protein
MDLSKQEFYVLFKRVNQNLIMCDFTLEKMNIFKEKLIYLLKRFSESSNPSDIILLPIIFSVAKRSFFKLKKEIMAMLRQMNESNSRKNTGDKNNNVNKIGSNINKDQNLLKYKHENERKNYLRNGELLLESIRISFSFLDVIWHEDISISALNYIYRFIEEPLHFEFDNKLYVVYNFLY